MIAYIDGHRDEFGVEPICRVLQVAPSTYYAAKTQSPSARAVRDEQLKMAIVGTARLREVQTLTPDAAWTQHRRTLALSRPEFDAYLDGSAHA